MPKGGSKPPFEKGEQGEEVIFIIRTAGTMCQVLEELASLMVQFGGETTLGELVRKENDVLSEG